MEYALLNKNNVVVDKVLNGDHRFPVHPDFKWIRCNSEVQNSWIFYADTNAFSDPRTFGNPIDEIRSIRNREIRRSDWRMTVDYPYDDQDKWKTYRQELRDMTTGQNPSYNDDGVIVQFEWPVDPNGKPANLRWK